VRRSGAVPALAVTEEDEDDDEDEDEAVEAVGDGRAPSEDDGGDSDDGDANFRDALCSKVAIGHTRVVTGVDNVPWESVCWQPLCFGHGRRGGGHRCGS
jgi:hypothetical protein